MLSEIVGDVWGIVWGMVLNCVGENKSGGIDLEKYIAGKLGGVENFEATQHSSLWYQKVKVPRGSFCSIIAYL